MSEILVVLVSGRGALAPLAGVPTVQRHVQAGKALGLDVIIVFPPERHALGAEIGGLVEGQSHCIPADAFEASLPSGPVLAVAAEWYLSMAALAEVAELAGRQPDGRAFGHASERGFASVPVALVRSDEAVAVSMRLGAMSAATALAALPHNEEARVALDARSEQRLSDNVSTAHAEGKLVDHVFGPRHVPPGLRLRPVLVPRLARLLRVTEFGPATISTMKIFVGFVAAWVIGGGTWTEGLAGALLYFAARLVGASGAVLARAGLADDGLREKLDFAGDTVLHFAMLWSIAGGPARGDNAIALAILATAGVLVSSGVAYVFVLKESWKARHRRVGQAPVSLPPGHDFIARFVRRDGIAYALLFAAAAGRLDLFLFAAAVASHLFYVLWMFAGPRTRSRHDAGPTMAFGRPA